MPELNFLLGNYCPNKATSFHLDFLVNLTIEIISSCDKVMHSIEEISFFSNICMQYYWFLILKIFVATGLII